MITTAPWSLLKEHTGLTDADLKQFSARVEATEANSHGTAGTMAREKCGRIVKQSATRCLYCESAITKGDAFQGT
jgi:hypothetical protein